MTLMPHLYFIPLGVFLFGPFIGLIMGVIIGSSAGSSFKSRRVIFWALIGGFIGGTFASWYGVQVFNSVYNDDVIKQAVAEKLKQGELSPSIDVEYLLPNWFFPTVGIGIFALSVIGSLLAVMTWHEFFKDNESE